MSYYRQASISFGPPLTRAVKALIIFTSAVFVLTYVPAELFHWADPLREAVRWFALTPYEVTHRLFIWQAVTYLFLHGGWLHIIFNLFAVWMFGSELESRWGARHFLFYFFLTGIGAGVFDVLLQPSRFVPTIGCSGAVYGLLLAYGVLFPDRPIFLWFILPVKAKWFVVIFGGIEFYLSLAQPGSPTSHVAHLGGMLFGYLYLRGGGLTFRLQLRYQEWRRARLRKQFEAYIRKQEKKSDASRWIN